MAVTDPLAQPLRFSVELAVGAALAFGYALTWPLFTVVRRPHDPREEGTTWAAVGLLVAQAIYVGFALFATGGDCASPEVAVEALGLALFGGLAAVGAARYSRVVVGAGWLLHGLWDVALHEFLQPGGHLAPHWYPGFCVGFDVAAAAAVWRLAVSEPAIKRV